MSYLYQRGRVPHSSDNLNPTTLKRKLWENWPLSTHQPLLLLSPSYRKKKILKWECRLHFVVCLTSCWYFKWSPCQVSVYITHRFCLHTIWFRNQFYCIHCQNALQPEDRVKTAITSSQMWTSCICIHVAMSANSKKGFTPFPLGLLKGILGNVWYH